MKKLIIKLFFITFSLQILHSQNLLDKNSLDINIITQYEKKGIIIKLPDSHYQVEPVIQSNASYDFAYMVPSQNVEYRISFIEDKFKYLRDDGMTEIDIINFILIPIASNIGQEFKSPIQFRPFPVESVKNEFNTVYGLTGFVEGNSDFAGQWKYVIIDGFYKENIGYIIRYSLFNDIAEFTKFDSVSNGAYNSFKFK